jgi:hypothetical protein
MPALLDFEQKYIQLKNRFEQTVFRAAKRITLKDILEAIPTDPKTNPRKPRLECSSELESFKEGQSIELGVFYQNPRFCVPTYKLLLYTDKMELFLLTYETPIKTYSGRMSFRLYRQWLRKIQQAIAEIPSPPF